MINVFNSPWNEETGSLLCKWWELDGLSSGEISKKFFDMGLKITRNSVIGRVNRQKLKAPESKSKKQKDKSSQRLRAANVRRAKEVLLAPRTIFIHGKKYNANRRLETMMTADNAGPKSVLIGDLRDGMCKAILGYQDGLLSKAVYCGEATEPQITRGSRPIFGPWCPRHKMIYTTEGRKR